MAIMAGQASAVAEPAPARAIPPIVATPPPPPPPSCLDAFPLLLFYPQIPCDPKLIMPPLNLQQLAAFQLTELEKVRRVCRCSRGAGHTVLQQEHGELWYSCAPPGGRGECSSIPLEPMVGTAAAAACYLEAAVQ